MSDCSTALFNLCATHDNTDWKSVPLGPLYLASCMEREGIKVDFFDYQLYDVKKAHGPEAILGFLKKTNAKNIAISCWDHLLPSVLLATKQLKEESPDKRIILGGLGPTGVSDLIVQRFPHVDVVVRGAGEEVLPAIVKNHDRSTLMKIPGVCLGGTGVQPHCTDDFTAMPPVDTIPLPAYDKIDLDQYDRVQLISSRGCPYRCAFCSIPGLWGHKFAFRQTDLFIKEVEFLHLEKGIRRVHIIDDTFAADRKRVMEFCKRIKTSCPNLKWTCYNRLDLVDEEFCEEMAEAGCDTMFFGIESGSNKVLERLGKRIDTDYAVEKASLAGRYFHIITSFIWGFPYETFEDFGKTIILMYYLTELCKSIEVQIFFLAPLATSDLRHQFSDQIRFSPDYLSYFTWGGASSDYGDKVMDLVRKNVDMFPGMCYFDSPDLKKKVELAGKLGLI